MAAVTNPLATATTRFVAGMLRLRLFTESLLYIERSVERLCKAFMFLEPVFLKSFWGHLFANLYNVHPIYKSTLHLWSRQVWLRLSSPTIGKLFKRPTGENPTEHRKDTRWSFFASSAELRKLWKRIVTFVAYRNQWTAGNNPTSIREIKRST